MHNYIVSFLLHSIIVRPLLTATPLSPRVTLVQLACPDVVFLLDPVRLQECAQRQMAELVEDLFGTDTVLKLGQQ